jgi:hypothetical protein
VSAGSAWRRRFLSKVKFETEWWIEVVKENDIKVEG